ncbi:hypothetical protein YPPY09_0230, partial [Yersinia pestis PY-09]
MRSIRSVRQSLASS